MNFDELLKLVYDLHQADYSVNAAHSACRLHNAPAGFTLEYVQQLYDEFDMETEYRDDDNTYS